MLMYNPMIGYDAWNAHVQPYDRHGMLMYNPMIGMEMLMYIHVACHPSIQNINVCNLKSQFRF